MSFAFCMTFRHMPFSDAIYLRWFARKAAHMCSPVVVQPAHVLQLRSEFLKAVY